MAFDYDAYQTARKILLIGFVLAIAFVNFLLLLKLVRSGGILTSPRRWMLTTLSGGDLLLAFFSLVVNIRLAFFDLSGADCSQIVNAGVYSVSFLPFVYAISLITLCAELMKRKQIQTSLSSPLFACVLVAAIPWVSALVFILPLNLVGFDTITCRYDSPSLDRTRAILVLSLILPAVFACIMSFVTRSKVVDPVFQVYGAQSPMPGMVISSQMQQPGNMQPMSAYATAPPADSQNKSMAAPPPGYDQAMQPQQQQQQQPAYGQNNFPQGNANTQFQQPQYQQPQYQQPQYQQPQFQQPQYQQPQYQQPQFQQPQYQQPPMVVQPVSGAMGTAQIPSDPAQVASSVAKEKHAIVRVALAHLVLVLPYAIYHLAYSLNEDRPDLDGEVKAALETAVEFLLYARSIVTPFIWFISMK